MGAFDTHIDGEKRPRRRDRPDERAIAAIAARQHGVVARRQLVEAGFGRGAIDRRVAHRRLHPVHRGVYAVGHPLIGAHGRWMAAVLACGRRAVLSHRAAAALWDLLPVGGGRIDVTTGARCAHGRLGIALHRVRRLDEADRETREGIPVTPVPRTLLDLAEVVTTDRLERAFEQADRLGLLDLRAMEELVQRSPGRHGLAPLHALLASACAPAETRSQLERRFLTVCDECALPRPITNVAVAGFEVDALWPRERLVVELDGYAFHRGRRAFEDDRIRDLELKLAGYDVVRVTSARLDSDRAEVVGALRALLRRQAAH